MTALRTKTQARRRIGGPAGFGGSGGGVSGVVLERVRIIRRGLGRPRTRPSHVLADKAYSSRGNRAYLRRRGIKTVIPVKKDQEANRRKRGRKGGRPPAFDAERYRDRNTAERCVNKLRVTGRWPHEPTNAMSSTKAPRCRLDQDLAPRPRQMIHRTRPKA
ncbi:hypothetical protein ETD86_12485 [Nonomuraea turkmeniaca]|uniref:Transposase IS4-like domain-containing protein n=1 Tax=Nonomuraea turkmeniaca TaxID=103838 RepID=A0A5S4FNC1_9ACTN|nr:hypothetical protein ETD86_12485 [Nonomuraea turkmeniaca]